MDLVPQLFADYNFYRRHTRNIAAVRMFKGFNPPDLLLTDERQQALALMVRWNVSHKIDPSLWLYTLFQARKWMYSPRWEHLISDKHKAFYARANRLGFYESRQRARRNTARAKAGQLYDPNRDLSPSVEAIKASYQRQGLSAQCHAQMRQETLGFHPGSAVCASCSLRGQCAQTVRISVPFDILGLRAGRITADEARAQADSYWARASQQL